MTMGPFDFSPTRKPAGGMFGDMGSSAAPQTTGRERYAAKIHASPFASPATKQWALDALGAAADPTAAPGSAPAAAAATPAPAAPLPAAPPSAAPKMPEISSVGQGLAHVGASIFDGIEEKRQDDHRLGLANALLGTAPGTSEISPQQRALANALANNPAADAPIPSNFLNEAFGYKPPSMDEQIGAVRASLMPATSPFSFGAPAPAGPPDLVSPEGLIRAASAQQDQAGDDDHGWLLDGLTKGW